MMKNLVYILVASIALMSCKGKEQFAINGKFENAAPENKVYLYALDKANPVAVDSTVMSEKGEFKFNYPSEEVNFFKITTGNNEYMIIAKNGDDIKLNADLADPNMLIQHFWF